MVPWLHFVRNVCVEEADFAMTSLINVLDEIKGRGYSDLILTLLKRMQRDPDKRVPPTICCNLLVMG